MNKCLVSAERKHRDIIEIGLALLAHASIPLKFWDEAFSAAAYLINIMPSRVLNFDTPLACLFGQQHNYNFLQVFGCACWPNLQPYNTRKLFFRSKKCAFLGYNALHKAASALILPRDVFTFHEMLSLMKPISICVTSSKSRCSSPL